MRYLKAILVVSLGLNVLLLLACGLSLRHQAPGAAQPPALTPPTAQVVQTVTTNTLFVTNAPGLLDWRAVESDDYRQYVANLRAIGCPEKTLRDIIVADINQLYRHRFLLAFPPTNRVEYWKPGDALANVLNEEHIARLQQFGNEKRELLKSLLGVDPSGEVELTSIQMDVFEERLLDFLTPEKRTAMKELERRFTAKYLNTFKDSVRGDNESSQAALAAKDEEALKILSPEEKFEYDLRRSSDAMYLRVALGDFELSEQEFRNVFPAMKRFVSAAGLPSLMAIVRGNGDPRDQTLPARRELQNALLSALGQKRFAELRDATGWNLTGE